MANHELDCTNARPQLPLYVGGDLDEDVQAAVTAHLAGCEACCQAWRRAVSAREALLGLRGDVTGEGVDLWAGIRAELVAEGRIGAGVPVPVRETPTREPGGAHRAAPRLLSAWPVWAAAACLVGLMFAGRLGGAPEPSGTEPVARDATGATPPVYEGAKKWMPTFVADDAGAPEPPRFGADPADAGRSRLRLLLPGEQALGERAVWYSTQPVGRNGQPARTTPVSGRQ